MSSSLKPRDNPLPRVALLISALAVLYACELGLDPGPEVGKTIACLPGARCACTAGGLCTLNCLGDDCALDCGSDSNCTANCKGDRCRLLCGERSLCTLNIEGRDGSTSCGADSLCTMNHLGDGLFRPTCAPHGQCTVNCMGGQCPVSCEANSDCTINCKSGSCSCSGAGCPST